ncbi:MAG: penicillin-binding protein 1C [Bacteroidales bacterium]|nr:penicillin-binding protein 1C [Candidatus Cacconaster scatequi]
MTRNRTIIALLVFGTVFLLWLFCLPKDPFQSVPYSTVVLDRNGELLGARVADDGQWRFPPCDSLPSKYKAAVIEFEDRGFMHHFGFSIKAIGRALVQNLRGGHTVSGASTITMQVIRMSRNKPRNIWQKAIETFMATRMESRSTKDEILCMYASHAPFGGNVIGLQAASWKYLGCEPGQMSWAEASLMAVLPNAPSSMHLSKNREALKKKRNRLLLHLHDRGYISESEYLDAVDESLPENPLPIPSLAFHVVQENDIIRHGMQSKTTIDIKLQNQIEDLADGWCKEINENGAADLAVIVIDVQTGDELVRIGNANLSRKRLGMYVDITRSPRSTGSILKPLLYCAALQEGIITPGTLLPDIPMNFNGFAPNNFDRSFNGAVTARNALCRSLNIPSVYLLKQYGINQFCSLLQSCGLTTIDDSAQRYGYSLILGGAETTLAEITSIYASLARNALMPEIDSTSIFPFKDKSAIWQTLDALSDVSRPDEIDWRAIESVERIAWKTGTSWGGRDAWATGVTPEYAVGVWVGNAEGGSCPNMTGSRTAGPVMFDIFNCLPGSNMWFAEPNDYKFKYENKTTESDYSGIERIFMLDSSPMRFIYPSMGANITIPRQLDGSINGMTLYVVHRTKEMELFWHMDGCYLGSTKDIHKMNINPENGKHVVSVMDLDANTIVVEFEVNDIK